MIGEGTVVKQNGKNATVRIEKKSACSGECSTCGLCSNPVYDAVAKNEAGAKVGDRVKLYMPTGKVFATAFLVYMLPLLCVFAIMGACWALKAPTPVTVILCITALVVWFALIRIYNKKSNLESTIIDIIE